MLAALLALALVTPTAPASARKVRHLVAHHVVRRRRIVRDRRRLVHARMLRIKATVAAARRKQEAIDQRLAYARSRVAQLKRQEQVHVEKLTELQQTVEQTNVQLEDSTYRLTRAQHQLAHTKAELTEIHGRFDEERQLASSRLRAMYKYSTTSEWDALLTSPNLVEFLTRYQYFKHISDQDQKILSDLAGMLGQMRHKKHRIDHLVTKTEQYTQSIQAQKQTAETATQQESQLLAQIRTQKQLWEKEQDQLEQSSREIEAMIRRVMAHSSSHPLLGTGRFIFPLVGVAPFITSPFGMRYHPIFHVWRMHTGVDFRAPMHSRVVAADSGVVLFAGWYDGYGKVVMINHGGGTVTLYAHLSEWLVHKGEAVHQGQEIALSGMTGFATGPHLHFEVRRNGKPVNPLGYLRTW